MSPGAFDVDDYRVAIVAEGTRRVADALGARMTRLGREGFEVDVLARPNGRGDELRDRGARVIPTPWGTTSNPVRVVSAYLIVQSHLLEHPPALVHGFGLPMARVAAVAANRVPAPGIFATIEDHRWEPRAFGGGDTSIRAFAPKLVSAIEEMGAELSGGLVVEGRQWMYRQIAERVDGYLVSCRRDAGTLRSRGIVEPPKLQRVEPGVGIDVTRFDPEDDALPSRSDARARLDVPETWRKVVTYRGSGGATRGLVDLIETIQRIHRRRPEIGWLVELHEPIRSRIRRRFESLSEQGAVTLVSGRTGDGVPRHHDRRSILALRAADLVVEPSLRPEVSLRAMEGAAMKRAVVAYDTSAQRAVVRDGQTGRLVPTGSVDRFADSVVELLDDPRRLDDMGIRAGSRAHDYFDRVEIDQNVLQKYDAVLSDALDS